MLVSTLTARPEIRVGECRAWQAALFETSWSKGGPTASAQMTLPFSSITTSTLTRPDTLIALASSGYGGFGRLIAFPHNIDTVFNSAFGLGLLDCSHSGI